MGLDERCSGEYGYTLLGYEEVYAGPDHEFVYMGGLIKPGDEVFFLPHNWYQIDKKYFGAQIKSSFKPVRRKKLWACKHKREDSANFCPVCMVFLRYVPEKW